MISKNQAAGRISWNQDKSPSNMAPSASPLLHRNHCSYGIHFISFSHRSDALFSYNQSISWLLHLVLSMEQTDAQARYLHRMLSSLATPHGLAVGILKLTPSPASLSMQNDVVLTSPKPVWLLKPGQNPSALLFSMGIAHISKTSATSAVSTMHCCTAKVMPHLLYGACHSRQIYLLPYSSARDN